MAGASGVAGEVFGSANHPPDRPKSFSKSLTHSGQAAGRIREDAQATLATAAESPPLHLPQD